MDGHLFIGKWITNSEFCGLKPRNVFHRQLEKADLPCGKLRDRHILFRKTFLAEKSIQKAVLYISADDYYKVYINGSFAGQGPAPSYHFRYHYNEIDVSAFLREGENVIAVHTLYQGLINRVWQSGDFRHGMILDLEADGRVILSSDETFKTKIHSGYKEIGTAGYDTQFLEEYDSRSPEATFYLPNFDDSDWETAKISRFADYRLVKQPTKILVFDTVFPQAETQLEHAVLYDFGANYAGYLSLKAVGNSGDKVTVRCGQELLDNGHVRHELRANCKYEETWILADGEGTLSWFDYKSFRYAEIILPKGVKIREAKLIARHYPFELKTALKPEYAQDEQLKRVWNLCVNTQRFGVQEGILDCMEREKGFYVGDGCYTALTNMVLTHDDSMVRALIDGAFSSSFITEGLVTCIHCSFMQEIAEFPLMLIFLVLWHYNFTKDKAYLKENYEKTVRVLESYRKDYETDGLLQNMDKWCVVEWPKNFQDGYDADIAEGKISKTPHVAINAYYIAAIRAANRMAEILQIGAYRDEKPLITAFLNAFYDEKDGQFFDSVSTAHKSLIGSVYPFAFGLCPDKKSEEAILNRIAQQKIHSLSLFGTFPALMGFQRAGREDLIKKALSDDGAWLRMLAEGATTTFEGWGKDTKWNTSLFHLTMSYAALFMADADTKSILRLF